MDTLTIHTTRQDRTICQEIPSVDTASLLEPFIVGKAQMTPRIIRRTLRKIMTSSVPYLILPLVTSLRSPSFLLHSFVRGVTWLRLTPDRNRAKRERIVRGLVGKMDELLLLIIGMRIVPIVGVIVDVGICTRLAKRKRNRAKSMKLLRTLVRKNRLLVKANPLIRRTRIRMDGKRMNISSMSLRANMVRKHLLPRQILVIW